MTTDITKTNRKLLGEVLRKIRKEADLTQKELSSAAGLTSGQAVSKIECVGTTKISTLQEILKATDHVLLITPKRKK